MSFVTPLGLLAALSIPTIIGIHFFRRRFQHRPVAGLFLWGQSEAERSTGRRLDRPPWSRSLLLELLAALLLSLLLGGLRFSGTSETAHLVFVLDNSASMAAVGPDGRSSRDRAIERIYERIDDEDSPWVSIILTGPRPIAWPKQPAYEIEPALEAYRPRLTRHTIAPALIVASKRASGGQVWFLTDRIDAAPTLPNVAVEAVGQPLPNVAIVTARRVLAKPPLDSTLFMVIANTGDAPARSTVKITTGDGTLLRHKHESIELKTNGALRFTIPIPKPYEELIVTLADDALAIDNRVVLIRPKPAVLSVANLLPAGTARQTVAKALAALPQIQQAEPGEADLLFEATERDDPLSNGQWRVTIGGDPASARPALAGPYLLEQANPLLQNMTLDPVTWAGADKTVDRASAIASCNGQTLIAEVREPHGRRIRVNIDLDRSDLHKTNAWPILIGNIVDARRARLPQLRRWNVRPGEQFRLQAPKAEAGALTGPSGTPTYLPPNRFSTLTAPNEMGVYTIAFDDRPFDRFAVNFLDLSESTLTDLKTGSVGTPKPVSLASAWAGGRNLLIETVAILLVVALILGNGYLLSRGRHGV